MNRRVLIDIPSLTTSGYIEGVRNPEETFDFGGMSDKGIRCIHREELVNVNRSYGIDFSEIQNNEFV